MKKVRIYRYPRHLWSYKLLWERPRRILNVADKSDAMYIRVFCLCLKIKSKGGNIENEFKSLKRVI